MEVHLWPGVSKGETLVVVGVTLPEKVKLPATVRIPIIPGSELGWAGEVASTTAEADVRVEPRVVKGVGGDYAEFEVKTFHRAQIELSGLAYASKGTKVSGEVEFVQTAPADVTAFALRVPATASKLKIDPQPRGEPRKNSAGESLYTLPSKELKLGQKVKVTFSFDTALPSAKAPMEPTTKLIIALVVLLVLAVLGVVVLFLRSGGKPPRAADGEADAF
jgi:hypothetical protein